MTQAPEPRGESFRPWRAAAAFVVFAAVWATPLEGLDGPAHRLLAVTCGMAVLWFTEAIPVAVTALVPVAAYPLLGIAGSKETAAAYVSDLTFLFLGGMLLAAAIEAWDVHKRIALEAMARVGTSPRALTGGLMLVSAALSMWISNTATSMMLLPIGLALLSQVDELTPDATPADRTRLSVAMLLAIAYGANVGGMATPVGTPTNTTLLDFWKRSDLLPGEGPSVGEWLVVASPFCGAMLLTTFLVLTWRLPRAAGGVDRAFFDNRIAALGPLSGGGKVVLGVFAATAAAWITRRPITLGETTVWPGWQPGYEALLSRAGVETAGMLHDATVAGAAAVLLFLLPGRTRDGEVRPLLRWDEAERSLPWGVLLLIGGGFAIAQAFGTTGLAAWTGEVARDAFEGSPEWLVVGGSSALITVLTEFTTNVATISTLLPTLASMSEGLGVDARVVGVPATLAASCAFMLPIATPPNAVVYGSGRVPLLRMISTGVLLNAASVVLLTLISASVVRVVLS